MTNSVTTAKNPQKKAGFTLIELSIVLVIIGLIVGGVLVGQDLIRAAEVRSAIAQVEKLNTGVNTFRGKFNAIPGDMAASTASQFGFSNASCAGTAGLRDGNGVIEGNAGSGSFLQAGGETGLFWNDLSSSTAGNLVDGSFSTATCTGTPSPASTSFTSYFLPSKLGRGAYLYAYANGGYNFYGLSTISAIASGVMTSGVSLSVIQAYNIDTKMDDGRPTTGNVLAQHLTGGAVTNATNSASASATTCYETTGSTYTISTNNGAGGNCSLSFRFQ